MNKSLAILLPLLFLIPLSCVDLDYDQPPTGGDDPNLPVNTTIAEIKAMHTIGQYEEITEDLTFAALVISDDEAGNFFKQLVVSDSTGGIEIRIEISDLHNEYPVGRKVYIKAKGLWLGDYNELIQLGAGVGVDDAGDPELIRIPESIVDEYIVKATYGNPVLPKTITLDNLTRDDVSTLVKLEGVQFITADAGQLWADPVLQETVNRDLEDCAKRRIIIRTSGFSSFAGDTTPLGNGPLVGVLSVYRDDYQIMIRDLDDVSMTGDRCGGSVPYTIAAIRDLYAQGTTTAPAGTVKGVVISDRTSQSVTGKNLYIQDATGGIVLRFTVNHSFNLGAEINVDISGGALEEFRGLLQINNLDPGSAAVVGNPGDVIPREATILEILNHTQEWESTLVKVKDATLSGNSIYSGEVTITDASGAMILFTSNQATFAQSALPTGQVAVVAIVSEFDVPQLIIRNTSDVSGGGGGDEEVDEDFEGLSDNVDIALAGWANIAVKGTRKWRSQVEGGNTYAQATAFGDLANEMEAWLITPSITLDEAKKITFTSAQDFYVHDGLSVWISSDFDGINVGTATWQPLISTIATGQDPADAFIPSGDVDLSGFTGPVRVGYKYVGSGPGGQTTSWRIDDVKVVKL